MKYSIAFLFVFSTGSVVAVENNAQPSYDNSFEAISNQDAAERFHDQALDNKATQNNLSDNERDKDLYDNEYWLVNKSQDLWVGVFDGKQVKVPKGIYPDITSETYLPQQVIRIKNNGKLSQFVLKSTMPASYGYPLHCLNKVDAVLLDKSEYMLLNSGCTDVVPDKNGQRTIAYNILFYSKKFDTLVSVNEFDSSSLIDGKLYSGYLKDKKGYFVYEVNNIAFRIKGKDQVEDVDPDTGVSLHSGEDESEDADGVQVLPLERLTEGK
ncbi:hypothetical protein [Lelliottia wanjuensis]|uniref:Uncharacterized protein n=1 Tax=Lelliottia wanjuensis TaxID=3050585 RepID=A0AAP4D7B6_9ENTR|nr:MULTISPECIES: hypothetical protein [unclassified Lelliottia]MDK9364712.1 hypothetical protein [Lelliottia sp. V106_12]MDK9586069.1 hypothetical protein [Lelliottia sp. V86_10]MDK9617608.1 hypothetical protein [Lelliottia sp. V106_9]